MAFEVEFSKRLDLFGAEIFAALNDKKVALEAQGKKLYNLSVKSTKSDTAQIHVGSCQQRSLSAC